MQGPSAEQEKILWQTLTLCCGVLWTGFGVAVVYGLVQVAQFLQGVLTPLALAGVLACLLSPIIDFLARRGWSRSAAVLALFGLLFLVGAGLVIGLGPILVEQAGSLIRNVPELLDRLRAHLADWLRQHPTLADQVTDWQGRIQREWPEYAPRLADHAWRALDQLIGGVGVALGLIFVPLYLFYFLRDRPRMEQRWHDYVPLRRSWWRDEVVVIVGEINKYLVAFFRGQVLVAGCIGILTALGLTLMGLKYGLLLGVLTGVLSLIPYLGLVASLTPALIIAYAQSGGSWGYVAGVLAVFVSVQVLEGTLISPKVMGDRTGLHPLTVVIAILVWSTLLGGLLGAILAIPLTATLKVLMFRYIWQPAPAP